MKKIGARIVADSICDGRRITSMIVTIPQIVVKELLRHRMFSFSSASMRAIPFERVIKDIEENPFIPLAWQKNHTGMQGTEYFTDETEIDCLENDWDWAMRHAISQAKLLYDRGLTKQLCNRLLEPFGFCEILITATEWENFFELRCPKYELLTKNNDNIIGHEYFRSKKDFVEETGISPSLVDWRGINRSGAEIHIQELAESMWDAMNERIPRGLIPGEWHIPFGDKFDYDDLYQIFVKNKFPASEYSHGEKDYLVDEAIIKIASARCARLSYLTFDKEIDYRKDIELYDRLLESKHMSPFEHCAQAMGEDDRDYFVKGYRCFNGVHGMFNSNSIGWCNNFNGWIQYRWLLENNK